MLLRRQTLLLCLALLWCAPLGAQSNEDRRQQRENDRNEAGANGNPGLVERRAAAREAEAESARLARIMDAATRMAGRRTPRSTRNDPGVEERRLQRFEKDVADLVSTGERIDAFLDLPAMDVPAFQELRKISRELEVRILSVIKDAQLAPKVDEKLPEDPLAYPLDVGLLRLGTETAALGLRLLPLIRSATIDLGDYRWLADQLQSLRHINRSIQVQSVHAQLAYLRGRQN